MIDAQTLEVGRYVVGSILEVIHLIGSSLLPMRRVPVRRL